MPEINRREALDFHSKKRPGKIEVVPTKRYRTQRDLALAYSPGVAEPCKSIAKRKSDVYKYTSKGNLVAVVTNGSAVLGLGDIGPEAAKPVMEGKGLLFKIYADIDVFDIELNVDDIESFVQTVKAISPTFGGINLEDIKSPECFEIEKRLSDELSIPVMHDDQHGTAIISAAALLNGLELTNKKIDKIKVVVNGAGAAAISCLKLYIRLGVKRKNIVLCDSKGVVRKDRLDLNKEKKKFSINRRLYTLSDAIKNADVFIGLSVGNTVTKKMLKTMKKDPLVFAMANPDPEIPYNDAKKARPDAIMATGRSDYPNQVNNVLGFPYIFRGALDVRATEINESMKLAAVRAISSLAKENVPEDVNLAYHGKNLTFGPDYIIPKPNDPRLITRVSIAVAKAAIKSGVAKKEITDWQKYEDHLIDKLGLDNQLIRGFNRIAKENRKKVLFVEADNYNILKAAEILKTENLCTPILLGNKSFINSLSEEAGINLEGIDVIDVKSEKMRLKRHAFADLYWNMRERKGVTKNQARRIMRDRSYFGSMMLVNNEADVLLSGSTRSYPEALKPPLEIVGKQSNILAGIYIVVTKKGPIFFADTTINKNPTEDQLLEITLLTADAVKRFGIKPVISLLSYSNFGSSRDKETLKIQKVVKRIQADYPSLIVDGEMQANFALNSEKRKGVFPFSKLQDKKVNTLIFPNLVAGNVAYKILQELSNVETMGPVLLGMKKSVHILQLESSVNEIVHMATIASVDANERK
ncbi:MAG: NADP-dependent malic enzyme [Flavobacteriales bacterium TMED191]|nr:MAG: NADP-dependent malic enzyme [Flavobacteriales bacterium TMED191]|tara:strand:- start:3100 stop:5361 length:2262 start_codon:yes stop_codon:yes gene_type:complete